MKQMSVYSTQQEVTFNFDEITANRWAELTDLQTEKVGFVEVYDHTYYTNKVDGYTMFKVMISKRKDINQETLEKEFNTRMKRAEQQSVPFDMEACLQEVTDDLTRMSDIKSKVYLAVYDHQGKRFLHFCLIQFG